MRKDILSKPPFGDLTEEEEPPAPRMAVPEPTSTLDTVSHLTEDTPLRVEICANNGQKSGIKPLLIKTSKMLQIKRNACNALKLKYSKNCKLFDCQGEEVFSTAQVG